MKKQLGKKHFCSNFNNLFKDGRLTFEDFNNYKSIIRSDKDIIYTKLPNGRTICGPPPPSGSAVTQGIINILSKFVNKTKIFSLRIYLIYI